MSTVILSPALRFSLSGLYEFLETDMDSICSIPAMLMEKLFVYHSRSDIEGNIRDGGTGGGREEPQTKISMLGWI